MFSPSLINIQNNNNNTFNKLFDCPTTEKVMFQECRSQNGMSSMAKGEPVKHVADADEHSRGSLDSTMLRDKPAIKKRKGKPRWKKPKDMPKRPLSAYNLFFGAERQRLVDSGVSKLGGFSGLAQLVSAKWKTLDDETKAPFLSRAKEEQIRYKREMRQWRGSDSSDDEESITTEDAMKNSVNSRSNDTVEMQRGLVGMSSFFLHDPNNNGNNSIQLSNGCQHMSTSSPPHITTNPFTMQSLSDKQQHYTQSCLIPIGSSCQQVHLQNMDLEKNGFSFLRSFQMPSTSSDFIWSESMNALRDWNNESLPKDSSSFQCETMNDSSTQCSDYTMMDSNDRISYPPSCEGTRVRVPAYTSGSMHRLVSQLDEDERKFLFLLNRDH
jgi:hypothetical protein